jgi:hypothetical protein
MLDLRLTSLINFIGRSADLMGIFTDLLKEVPLSAVLKEKLLDAEAKYAASETQVSLLEIDLKKANIQIKELQAENQRLKDEINTFSQAPPELHETAQKILRVFASHNVDRLGKNALLNLVQANQIEVNYYLDELEENGYLEPAGFNRGEGGAYRLGQKGRKYLMEHPS